MTEPTPTPWNSQYGHKVYGADGWLVSNISGPRPYAVCEANAEFIVRAVNAHDALLAAAKDALALVSILPAGENEFQVTAVYESLRAAIALAEGQS